MEAINVVILHDLVDGYEVPLVQADGCGGLFTMADRDWLVDGHLRFPAGQLRLFQH